MKKAVAALTELYKDTNNLFSDVAKVKSDYAKKKAQVEEKKLEQAQEEEQKVAKEAKDKGLVEKRMEALAKAQMGKMNNMRKQLKKAEMREVQHGAET